MTSRVPALKLILCRKQNILLRLQLLHFLLPSNRSQGHEALFRTTWQVQDENPVDGQEDADESCHQSAGQ